MSPASKMSLVETVKAKAQTAVVPSTKLAATIDAYLSLKAKIAELDEQIAPLKATITEQVSKLGGKVGNDDWTASIVESENRTISREALLNLGVKPTVIAKATTVKPYAYVKVTKKNGGE